MTRIFFKLQSKLPTSSHLDVAFILCPCFDTCRNQNTHLQDPATNPGAVVVHEAGTQAERGVSPEKPFSVRVDIFKKTHT